MDGWLDGWVDRRLNERRLPTLLTIGQRRFVLVSLQLEDAYALRQAFGTHKPSSAFESPAH